jgi:hypothetical protein
LAAGPFCPVSSATFTGLRIFLSDHPCVDEFYEFLFFFRQLFKIEFLSFNHGLSPHFKKQNEFACQMSSSKFSKEINDRNNQERNALYITLLVSSGRLVVQN